uniref:Peroxisomal membrane protein PEX16 n=1 Tax=Macrostomum lignano TaxID=282301 RepID=A0A1I8FF70_9PLAT
NEFSVEICGALKSIVATGARLLRRSGLRGQHKAAVIRLGFMEILRYVQRFYRLCWRDEAHTDQSCGMGDIISSWLQHQGSTHDGSGPLGMHDLVTTCYGGRNRKLGEAMVLTGKPLRQLEKEMLDGQRLQGPLIAAEVHRALQEEGPAATVPLMVASETRSDCRCSAANSGEPELPELQSRCNAPAQDDCVRHSFSHFAAHCQRLTASRIDLEELRERTPSPFLRNIEKMLRNFIVITAEKMRHSVWMLQLLLLLLWQPPCDCVSISRDKGS